MAKVRELRAVVTADTSQFKRGLKTAERGLANFGAHAGRMAKNVGLLGAALGAAAVGGLSLLVKRQFEAIDATAKFADRIGIATEELVGLQHAARITGVSQQNLELGLQRMTRRISEAAQGTGEAQNAIRELGLDAERLNEMSPDRQFRELAEAMSQVANQGDRVRLAMRLFDSEGVALVNTLRLGKQGLIDMRNEAEKLGLTFSREEARSIEKANDAMTRLNAALAGLSRTLAIEVAPIVSELIEDFVRWANEGEGLGEKIRKGLDTVRLELLKTARTATSFGTLFGLSKGEDVADIDAQIEAIQRAARARNRFTREQRREMERLFQEADRAIAKLEEFDRRALTNDSRGAGLIGGARSAAGPRIADSRGAGLIGGARSAAGPRNPQALEDVREFGRRFSTQVEIGFSDGLRAALDGGSVREVLRSFSSALQTTVLDAVSRGFVRALGIQQGAESLFRGIFGGVQTGDDPSQLLGDVNLSDAILSTPIPAAGPSLP